MNDIDGNFFFVSTVEIYEISSPFFFQKRISVSFETISGDRISLWSGFLSTTEKYTRPDS